MIFEDSGSVAGLYDVTGQSDFTRNIVNLEQMMFAPSVDDISTLVESAVTRLCLNVLAVKLWSVTNFRFPFPGLVNDLTCLRLDCCHVSWVSHLGVALPCHFPKFHLSMMLFCRLILSHFHHPLAFSMLMCFRGSLSNLFVTCLASSVCYRG